MDLVQIGVKVFLVIELTISLTEVFYIVVPFTGSLDEGISRLLVVFGVALELILSPFKPAFIFSVGGFDMLGKRLCLGGDRGLVGIDS